MNEFVELIKNFFADMGYVGIFVMMTIESSFIPFPSEAAMIPAGISVNEGKMSFLIAFLVGTAGAWLGATINYFIGFYLGAPVLKKFIEKYWKFVFLKIEHYNSAEKFFQKNGEKATLIGRFIPGVRQIISLPAGVFKMNFAKFSLFTIIGAGIWNIVLLLIGYFFAHKQKEILGDLRIFGLTVLVFVIIYLAYHFWAKKKFAEKNFSKK